MSVTTIRTARTAMLGGVAALAAWAAPSDAAAAFLVLAVPMAAVAGLGSAWSP